MWYCYCYRRTGGNKRYCKHCKTCIQKRARRGFEQSWRISKSIVERIWALSNFRIGCVQWLITVKKRIVDIGKFKDRASLQDDWYLIANSPVFAGLPAAFVVLCVLTKEVRTMARITTKEYVAARQMKKNGGCISGDKPGGAVSVCVIGEGVKSNE